MRLPNTVLSADESLLCGAGVRTASAAKFGVRRRALQFSNSLNVVYLELREAQRRCHGRIGRIMGHCQSHQGQRRNQAKQHT